MTLDLPALLETAQKHLYPNYRQPPLVMERGEGLYVWDSSGKRYLDLYAGIAVNALGHAHPAVLGALQEQASKLCHLSNYYYNEPNVRLSEVLCRLTDMDRALFCNSGTEANEAALKLVRHHFYLKGQKERYTIVAFDGSFHGRTLGALALTGQMKYRDGFGPLSGVVHVPYGDLERVREVVDDRVAGIIVEPVKGEGGVLPAPDGFLEGLRAIADERGCLLMADEIQTGGGRTGRFLAFQHTSVRPDVVTLAKAIGGGLPIGAMLCTEALAGSLPPGTHGSTFGGNALASAVSLAVMNEIETKGLMQNAARLGAYLAERLADLVKRYPAAEASRGSGLLQALVLAPDVDVRAFLAKLRDNGLLVTVAGERALRFSPPLIVSQAELDEGLAIIEEGLKELS